MLAVLVSYDFKTCDGGDVEEVAKSRRASESNGGRREHVECVQAEQEEAENCQKYVNYVQVKHREGYRCGQTLEGLNFSL